MNKFTLMFSFIFLSTIPEISMAYIDPGVSGVLFQYISLFVFCFFSFFIFRPIAYLTLLLKKFINIFKRDNDEKTSEKANDIIKESNNAAKS